MKVEACMNTDVPIASPAQPRVMTLSTLVVQPKPVQRLMWLTCISLHLIVHLVS
jgi:hypothetical protein